MSPAGDRHLRQRWRKPGSGSYPGSVVRHPAEPVGTGGVSRQRRRERTGRRLGDHDDRAVCPPRTAARHRARREPAQPSPVTRTQHEHVPAVSEAGEFRGSPSGNHGLLDDDVTWPLTNGLADGCLDQRVAVCRAIGIRILRDSREAVARLRRGKGARTVDMDQQQPCPAPPRFPGRPGERPPACPRPADTHDEPRAPACHSVHSETPSGARAGNVSMVGGGARRAAGPFARRIATLSPLSSRGPRACS